jgi:two-component sensor histidine kinase/PAS domain-containing protein
VSDHRLLLPGNDGRLLRWLLVAILMLAYSAAFVILHRTAGDVAMALACVPMAAAGWLLGLGPCMLVALGVSVLSVLLFARAGENGLTLLLQYWPGALVTLMISLMAAALNRLFLYADRQTHDLRREIIERRWAENALRTARDELEQRVAARTADLLLREAALSAANASLQQEVAERKRAETALRASEERYKATVEVSEAFASLGQRLNAATTAQETAAIILDVADQLLGWDAGFLISYSPADDRISSILTMDVINGQRADAGYTLTNAPPTAIIRQTIEEGGQLIYATDAPPPPEALSRFGDESRDSATLMFVPIRNGTGPLGILSVQSYSPHAYRPEDLQTLQALADHCSGALERLHWANALQESEARYRSLFENSPISLWEADLSHVRARLDELRQTGVQDLAAYFGTHPEEVTACIKLTQVTDVNRSTLNIYGAATKEEFLRSLPQLIEPMWPAYQDLLLTAAAGQPKFQIETAHRTISGAQMRILLSWSMAPGDETTYRKVLVSILDITDRHLAAERLQASLAEKEVLLKEIHHRVKNNLQVISSLLNLQSRGITDAQAAEVLRDSHSRVKTMALVHEKLYQSHDLVRVDLSEYTRSLAAYLFRAYGVAHGSITLCVQAASDVQLSIDSAIPCGLILNEVLTNSLKYAFPALKACGDGGNGCVGPIGGSDSTAAGAPYEIRIEIGLVTDARGTAQTRLLIADNGVGLPAGLASRPAGSLGLQLVHALVEQIGGTIDVSSDRGTRFVILFPAQRGGENG